PPRLVPLRRFVSPQRRAHAAPEAAHRPLLGPRLRHSQLKAGPMSNFEYAPAPESRSVVDIASSYGLFIDGKFTEAADGATFKTVNPATEEVLADIAEAGEADIDRAVAAARRAQQKVRGPMPGAARAQGPRRTARPPAHPR